jgi:hypothetical protein
MFLIIKHQPLFEVPFLIRLSAGCLPPTQQEQKTSDDSPVVICINPMHK